MNRLSIVWLMSAFAVVLAHTPAANAAGNDRDAAHLIGAATPRIVNGTPTSSYPAVGALLVPFDPADPSVIKELVRCSGTMIGCNTFLTAAHCVCPQPKTGAQCQGPAAPQPADYQVFLQHGGFFAIASIAVHPAFKLGTTSDLAVIKLSSPMTGIAPVSINTTGTPAIGTLGTIVGFGRTGGDPNTNLDFGMKRVGKVTTSTCPSPIPNSTHLCWSFTQPLGPPGQDSNICTADSGGPLFIASDAGKVVAGTTSGRFSLSCLPPDNGFDADVFLDRAWIQGEGGADLDSTSCGDLPQVETADTAIFAAADELSLTTAERSYSIDVPNGASLLRVALNGDDEGDNNFDLSLQSPTTATGNDCTSTHNSQYEFCEIHNPAGGAWKVLVTRVAGEGQYQLTATIFNAPGVGPGPRNKEQQVCAKAIRGWFTTFFKAKLAAQHTCIDNVNKGKGTVPCPDAKAAAAIAKAVSKIDAVKVGKKCPAEVVPTIGLGGSCAGVATADDLAACIVSETEDAVDALLAVEYSKPDAVLASAAEQKCQAAVAKAAKQYATSRLGILSSCLTQRDKGKLASCPDVSAQEKLTKAATKVGPAITKKCSDAVVQTLNSATFGGSCATATTATALASCQVAEHEAVIDDALLSRLQ